MLLHGAVLLCAFTGGAAAQAEPVPVGPPPAAPKVAVGPELVLQNLAPAPRREGAAVVVPFAAGAVRETPPWHVPGQPTAWQPFGARWPDGSLRQALCLFVAELPAIGETRVTLEPGPGPDLPAGDIAMPPATIEVVVRQGERTVRAQPMRVADLEANSLRRVELRRARLGDTGLLAELIVTAWRDQAHAWVDAAVFFSDPRIAALQCSVDELAIETRGMALALRHAGRLGIAQWVTDDGSRCVLLGKNVIGDGQGLRRTGALLPKAGADPRANSSAAAASIAPLLGATRWGDSGAFGPFGLVPEPPRWLQGNALRTYFAKQHRAFANGERPGGDPFGLFAHGLAKMAGQTGDQGDFGTVKLSLVAASGLPSHLLEVELSMLQEGCRPVHFFEVDGSPVDPAAHPEWVVWSGRTHWHAGVSKDRLGKAGEGPFDTHSWTGKDREHWSSNYLSAFALLTGAHWARAELANEARLYVAGQTVDPKLTTSGISAPRGGGRTELSAAWNLLVTGDETLRARMHERMDLVYRPQWAGKDFPPAFVRPLCVNAPDPRMLQGKHIYWNPWQEATAAVGFAAHHLVTGNQNARELAEALAINVVRHGWLLTPQENEVAMVIRWLDGQPFTAEQWQSRDPTLVGWSQGTAFTEWSVGAVEIARVAASRDGDTALAEKCAAIQQRMRSARRPPPDGGIDRFGEWDAVRWPPQ